MNVIYYRKGLMDKEELNEAEKYFKCVNLLTDISSGDFVIGRYSLLPFYSDQIREIKNIGAKAINNYEQHLYVADLQNYVADLDNLTPKTWRNLVDLPEEGPFILKGETNSKKSRWSQYMFAVNKQKAIEVHSRLCDDGLISYQNIYIRKYVPLITYMTGIGGIPITKEFRFFVLNGMILCGGYYWQNYVDDLPQIPSVDEVPQWFLRNVINIIGDKCNFYTIDVAQTSMGEWIVIELNDGCQSGLSCIEPEILYKRLSDNLSNV